MRMLDMYYKCLTNVLQMLDILNVQGVSDKNVEIVVVEMRM